MFSLPFLLVCPAFVLGPGTVAEYKYDPFGRRVEKSANGKAVRYFYDGEDILFEYTASGIVGNRYVHGPGIDEPLALINNKGVYYYHADGLGSVVALTDTSQAVVQDYRYDSFGHLKDQKNRIKQPFGATFESGVFLGSMLNAWIAPCEIDALKPESCN